MVSLDTRFTALVLAASRGNPNDPLAPHCDGGNKCLIDVAGQPMIVWVLRTLLASPQISRVLVSTDDDQLLDDLPEFADARSRGDLQLVPSGKNLFESVASALRADLQGNLPALITTADNPLLTVEMVEYFCKSVVATRASGAIAMTRAEVMRAEYPNGQRRFYAFKDGEFSNCNLYAVVKEDAVGGARIFAEGGQFRKKTMRILNAFGLVNLLLYRLGVLSLQDVAERMSRLVRAPISFVEMPYATACIDVDNERTLTLARHIMEERGRAAA
ncbi:MAG: nucleotidyltransferase family protein [Pseudomonadota bacterium]